tara:strand:+ start:6659 stop:6910 length:252 start_codon:yes stop_codon:yes gene_type:complete
MKDTTDQIKKKQLDIILSKTNGERLEMGLSMMQAGYDLIKERVERERPDINEKERIYFIFEELYKNEFSEEEKARIKQHVENL